MWNSASLKYCHGSVMFWSSGRGNTGRQYKRLIGTWSSVVRKMAYLITSPYCQFWQFCCWHDVLVLFQNPAWQAETDTAVSLWVSRAKYQLHLRNSLSWPFCNDSPEWRSAHMCTWFWRHGDAFGTTNNALFHAFITLRSQFHLHRRSQRALTEIVSKITPNLGLVL